MENVYKAMKTILLFVIVVLAIQTVGGDKVAQNMILFILFSMVLIQSDTVADYLTKVTDNLTANT